LQRLRGAFNFINKITGEFDAGDYILRTSVFKRGERLVWLLRLA